MNRSRQPLVSSGVGQRKATMKPEDVAAAHRLRAAWDQRSNQSLSQEEAGNALGFGQSAVSQYLNAKIPLGLEATIKWAALLGCAASDLRPEFAHLITPTAPYEDRAREASKVSEPSAEFMHHYAAQMLSGDEREMLAMYRATTDDARQLLRRIAAELPRSIGLRVADEPLTDPHARIAELQRENDRLQDELDYALENPPEPEQEYTGEEDL